MEIKKKFLPEMEKKKISSIFAFYSNIAGEQVKLSSVERGPILFSIKHRLAE